MHSSSQLVEKNNDQNDQPSLRGEKRKTISNELEQLLHAAFNGYTQFTDEMTTDNVHNE